MHRLVRGKRVLRLGLEGLHPAPYQLHMTVSSQPLQAQHTRFTAHLLPRSHLGITAL